MKNFYKIIDNKAQVGSGTPPDNTWVVYEVGQEPQELLDVLEAESKEQSLISQIKEAKAYLSSTDFYMTVDKYAELDEARKVELTAKRVESRELINTLEAELGNI